MMMQILQIIACYAIGLIAGNLIFLPFSGILAPFVAVAGAVMALPILLLVVVVFALAREGIMKHLVIWCVVAPFLIVAVWLAIEWETDYSHRGYDIYWYLSLRSVWERTVLALTCASISSAVFWHWNRIEPGAVPPTK